MLRPAGAPGTYTLLAKSTTGSGTDRVSVATRIPVHADDVIALQALSTVNAYCTKAATSGNTTRSVAVADFDPDSDVAVDFNGSSPVSNQQVNLSAVLEPDVDGDGYGDVTQDLCPTDPTRQDACPAQPTSTPTTTPTGTPTSTPTSTPTTRPLPDTVLAGQVAEKTTKRKVTLRFSSPTSGATFTCRVDKKAAKPCASPLKKKYKRGKHVVVVTAKDPVTGLVDPTPLTVRFKVTQKR
ncbi:hypothetical protein [Nocardioides anomalus]|uniref:hypothetical protein n=1 Tax=Nocardioides anomalus TaxID=2712223 RepID=UPI0018AD3E80|nr:hypothetical protein [Nocardioides anomalus]